MPRRSASSVADSRAAVVDAAVRRASIEGLEGLTIGSLAKDTAMSKSGLFGLFGDKEHLQLAALAAGIELFVSEVWAPVASVTPGLRRLRALCESWISYHERAVLPGGCFMTTAAVEFDARPGAVRDQTSTAMNDWLNLLERDARLAIEGGELSPGNDPADIAFSLNALASAASWTYLLTNDRAVFDRARRTMQALLGDAH